ncbi:MAG: diacylglycerol kinase family protein [Schaalia turicensis]|nr:diacylglycerol kinase family protein [Schaalia turicensis]
MTAHTTAKRRSIHLLISSMSAGGRSVNVGPEVVRILRGGGWAVRVSVTRASDDPCQIASATTEDVIGALGGDGFISAIARGAHEAGALFAPIPGGRGNDLCRALGISPDASARAKQLAELGFVNEESDELFASRIRPMDGMWVTTPDGTVHSLVLGLVSLGLDAKANLLANESMFTSGPIAYGYGAFAALATHRPSTITLKIDGQERELTGWITSVSNSGRLGGGVRLVPQSDMTDGIMELCHVEDIPLLKALPILAKVVGGRSQGHEVIHVEPASSIEITQPVGMVAMADGDKVAEIPFTVTSAPHIVDVLV